MELTLAQALILSVGSMGLGIIMLVRGGNWTVDAAVFVAQRYGLSPLIVGFTIVALGTSLPEMVISALANYQGSPGIALGNVIGSNIANILLVIGVSAAFGTLFAHNKAIRKDLVFMMIATVILVVLMMSEVISAMGGAAMILLLIGYVLYQYRMAIKGEKVIDEESPEFANKYAAYLFLAMGLVAIALGAEFLVRGARVSASVIGVPEAVIALSIIAFGTSLPELSTCIIAARKGHSGMVLGNIIGSNVFNILMILGVTAMLKPIQMSGVAPQLMSFDIWVVLGISAIFTALLLISGKITRPVGVVFIGGYLFYNVYIYTLYIGA